MKALPVRSLSRRRSLRVSPHETPGHGSSKNAFDLVDLFVVLVILGLVFDALELVAGAVAVDHHRLDAGTERVVLLAEPIELSQIVRRLNDALVARRADVELLVLVFGLERVGLDRARSGSGRRSAPGPSEPAPCANHRTPPDGTPAPSGASSLTTSSAIRPPDAWSPCSYLHIRAGLPATTQARTEIARATPCPGQCS